MKNKKKVKFISDCLLKSLIELYMTELRGDELAELLRKSFIINEFAKIAIADITSEVAA